MKTNRISAVSRRHFIRSSVLASTGVWLMPRQSFAAGHVGNRVADFTEIFCPLGGRGE
jgi:hypothetical protein